MTKRIEDNERVRKVYAARGERSQKTMGFRCDFENWEYLQKIPNKGRWLNNLIAEARTNQKQP